MEFKSVPFWTGRSNLHTPNFILHEVAWLKRKIWSKMVQIGQIAITRQGHVSADDYSSLGATFLDVWMLFQACQDSEHVWHLVAPTQRGCIKHKRHVKRSLYFGCSRFEKLDHVSVDDYSSLGATFPDVWMLFQACQDSKHVWHRVAPTQRRRIKQEPQSRT